MSSLFRLIGVTCPGLATGFSCEIEQGGICTILTVNEDESRALTRLFTGMTPYDTGTLLINGREPAGLTLSETAAHRYRTGVVPPRGGLISNLKLWENITLPQLYHTGTVSGETERKGLAWLEKLGYSGRLMALPAHLTPHEQRIAVWVRMLLTEPDVVVYNNCLDDLPAASLPLFLATARDYHAASERRTTIFLTSDPDLAEQLPAARLFTTAPHHTTALRDQ